MANKKVTIDDAAGMSDEDFLAQNFPADASDSHAEDDQSGQSEEDEDDNDDTNEDDDDSSEGDDDNNDAGDDNEDESDEEQGETGEEGSEKESDGEGDGEDESGEAEGDVEAEGKSDGDAGDAGLSEEDADKLLAADDKTSDAKAQPQTLEELQSFYNEVTAEFNANGSKMQVTSAKDIIQLKQMGAGFNSKMKGLKPVLKTMQMLENHGLMDEEKLNFLIDVSKGDKDAIIKLIKDNDLDLLDVDITKESGYKSNDYRVSEDEVVLRETLREIEGTESYDKTMEIVNPNTKSSWDQSSRDVLLSTPSNIAMINAQMSDGTFDIVQSEVAKQRMLNQLVGVSDIEAYMQTGKQMQSDGKFATKPAASAKESKPKSKTSVDKQRRKKASGTKSTKGKSTKMKKDFNPLGMDDADFEAAMAAGKFN